MVLYQFHHSQQPLGSEPDKPLNSPPCIGSRSLCRRGLWAPPVQPAWPALPAAPALLSPRTGLFLTGSHVPAQRVFPAHAHGGRPPFSPHHCLPAPGTPSVSSSLPSLQHVSSHSVLCSLWCLLAKVSEPPPQEMIGLSPSRPLISKSLPTKSLSGLSAEGSAPRSQGSLGSPAVPARVSRPFSRLLQSPAQGPAISMRVPPPADIQTGVQPQLLRARRQPADPPSSG